MSDIEEFFANKSVFVTGATGFVGKVLVEKLLRSCERIENVFILVRTKKNENVQERFKKFVDNSAFNRLKNEDIERFKKLKVISGDVTKDGLGISQRDRQELVDKVHVVFHCAAMVRFDLSLAEVMKINVMGTHRVLTLAETMPNLKAFAFVSTAFSQSYETRLEEKHYATDYNVLELLKRDSREIDMVEKLLFKKGHPSTYTMSKAFAEDLVFQYRNRLPVLVVRPSIIICAFSEPEVGFVEGFQSATGLLAGSLTGLIRVILGGRDTPVAMVPVDFTVNATIAAAYKRSTEPLSACSFYNSSNVTKKNLSWGNFHQHMTRNLVPLAAHKTLFWYPDSTSDFGFIPFSNLFLRGKKMFLTKLQMKVFAATRDFRYFTRTTFDIKIENLQEMFEKLNENDKQTFLFDDGEVDWHEQVKKQLKGIRKFIFLEDDSSIPKARIKLKRLYWANVGVKAVLSILFLYAIFKLVAIA